MLAVDRARLNQTNSSIPIASIPIAIIDKVPGSGTGGTDEVSVAKLAEKEESTVPPAARAASTVWKSLGRDKVNNPITGILSSEIVSTSDPKIENEAIELVAVRLTRLNGDRDGTLGVHTCPPVGGAVQSVAPLTPASSSVNVKLMFGATENVIKSGVGKITPVA